MTSSWQEQAHQAYQAGNYLEAAEFFGRAAADLDAANQPLDAAEMRNNQAVALLQAEQATQALTLIEPTIELFSAAADARRLGMAWGNRASALEALGRVDEALAAYQEAARWLGEAGEAELQAVVLKSQAALQLKQGKLEQSAVAMLQQMGVNPRLPWWQRLLRKILHRVL